MRSWRRGRPPVCWASTPWPRLGDRRLDLDARRRALGVELHELALDVSGLTVRPAAGPVALAAQLPGVRVVGERAIEDVGELGADLVVEDRRDELDAVVEVAGHQVGRADVDARLLAVALEGVDPGVLEEAPDDRCHRDPLG